jgi:hypothetical protein
MYLFMLAQRKKYLGGGGGKKKAGATAGDSATADGAANKTSPAKSKKIQ